MKRDGARDSRVERSSCCEWPALPAVARMRSQPMLLLKVITVSLSTRQQGSVSMSVAHIITREHDHVDAKGLGRTGSAPYCLWHSEDLAPPLSLSTAMALRRVRSCTLPRCHSGAGSVGGVWES